jgi:probable HAF family extracellular repeat protein
MTTRTMHSRPGRLALAATAVATLTVGISVVANPAAAASELRLVGATSRTADAASSEGLGFVLEPGRFKPVVAPRGVEGIAPPGIAPIDINDRGQIVGGYADAGGASHAFLLDRGGRRLFGINDRGQIVGVSG